jgi:uncharacterized membrane protein YjfL (UPF0719 family)
MTIDYWQIAQAYLITFGWAIVGSVSMAIGVLIALKIFTKATRDVDEWSLIKENNTAMAIILAALILAIGYVVATVTKG